LIQNAVAVEEDGVQDAGLRIVCLVGHAVMIAMT
jgi:hypothetical protein